VPTLPCSRATVSLYPPYSVPLPSHCRPPSTLLLPPDPPPLIVPSPLHPPPICLHLNAHHHLACSFVLRCACLPHPFYLPCCTSSFSFVLPAASFTEVPISTSLHAYRPLDTPYVISLQDCPLLSALPSPFAAALSSSHMYLACVNGFCCVSPILLPANLTA
jgi:hypothetical protein